MFWIWAIVCAVLGFMSGEISKAGNFKNLKLNTIAFIIYSLNIDYEGAKVLKLQHNIAATTEMIGTSDFFKLSVSVVILLFGLLSGAALIIVVGILVKVPVMLALVKFANNTRRWVKE